MTQIDRTMGLVGNVAIKAPCRVATTANITLSGEQTIDGVACVTGDRVLVWNQTTGSQNGIYEVDTGTWSRTQDFDGNDDVASGTIVLVRAGNTGPMFYRVSTSDPIVIDTSTITFVQSLTGDSSSMTFLQAGTGAVSRSVQSKLREVISVFDFMTSAQITDVIARTQGLDVATAIQAALDKANTEGYAVYFPAGTYKIGSALTIYSNSRYFGVGGHLGSIITGSHAGNLFASASLEDVEIDHLAFTGSGCTGLKLTTAANYHSQMHIHDCHFYANLLRCLDSNFVVSDIHHSTFGYYGTAGANHSHIRSLGNSGGNTTNQNRIHHNRFFAAAGAGVGIFFDIGFGLLIEHNDFEQNSVCPITIQGMAVSAVRRNYFESNNTFTSFITYANASAGGGTNLINEVDGNWFGAGASITSLISYSGSGSVEFTNNRGTGMGGGKTVTNSSDGFVSGYYNNALTSYAGTLANRWLLNFIHDQGGTKRMEITTDGRVIMSASMLSEKQGANVASATNLLVLADGNYFNVTGATQIDLVDTTYAQGGTLITLKFDSNPVVRHNQAASGTGKPIMLSGAANFSTGADDTLTLRYDSTAAKWYEVARTVI